VVWSSGQRDRKTQNQHMFRNSASPLTGSASRKSSFVHFTLQTPFIREARQ